MLEYKNRQSARLCPLAFCSFPLRSAILKVIFSVTPLLAGTVRASRGVLAQVPWRKVRLTVTLKMTLRIVKAVSAIGKGDATGLRLESPEKHERVMNVFRAFIADLCHHHTAGRDQR
jgi:hypothetical protein